MVKVYFNDEVECKSDTKRSFLNGGGATLTFRLLMRKKLIDQNGC